MCACYNDLKVLKIQRGGQHDPYLYVEKRACLVKGIAVRNGVVYNLYTYPQLIRGPDVDE